MVVHHFNDARSQRILWLLAELGVAYDLRVHVRSPYSPPEFKQIHPLGKAPVLVDCGATLAESGAIVDYILRHYGNGQLCPDLGSSAYDRFVEWLHYAEGSIMPALLLRHYVGMVGAAGEALMPRVMDEINIHLDYLNAALANSAYLLGESLSGADIQMSLPGEFADYHDLLGGRSHIAAWLDRCQARPAYRAAVKRGGPYRFAKRLPT